MKVRRTRRLWSIVGLLSVAALTVSCSSAGEDAAGSGTGEAGSDSTYQVGMIGTDSGGNPVRGGTFTMAGFSEPRLLDPAETIVAGSTGGVEMAAVYDVLLRWDSEANKVVPRLAESISANDDFTTWTLTLRDGVKFSDGSPLNAAAVKWSIERYVEKGATEAKLWQASVTKIGTPDERTVVFELADKWPTFDHMLTSGPGMIVAKSADAGGKFKPVGAGPFTFERHAPQEELVLKANDGYWDGRPNLDRIRVVYLNDPHASMESFGSGGVNSVFLRDPDLVDKALADKLPGFLNMVSLGNVAMINAAEGRPGADPRVRQAMHHAINPELIRQRAFQGAGVASNAIFPEFSQWHTDTEPLPYDPEQAKRLLSEAKADGFDGKVSYTDAQDPASRATALAFKSSLEAVGFEVELDLTRTVADQISKVAVKQDYDVAGWGISWREAGPYGRMFATLHSKGNLSAGMPTGKEMDALLDEFRGAETLEQQRAVMAKIQQQWNEDVPALVYGPTPEFLVWAENIHGVVDTTNSMVLLDKAWIEGGGS
ncbi:ABC-type dipeptide transport system, periplasmic component [Saccharomonospora marina XMU15]|uniref:ABC-type dipeptide transport system, periplasmic component n=1 Tax=Saccharomonospora marina XMU15 TaxID=882083 RepID=H5X9D7_9PSEU|nr:ABC transporter substrate-binding protein [Saccharomonospora marina]EHR50302.1 ABC-type dipeptide transport system, periplasmic component [Saccharomonospora marina XMU15]